MNLDQFKKNLNQRVQLEPVACWLDPKGRGMPVDDDWIVQAVREDEIEIFCNRANARVRLGKDHIHHYTSNPNRTQRDLKYGFLTLNVQVFVQGTNVSIRPNAGPGKPVDPRPVQPSATAQDRAENSATDRALKAAQLQSFAEDSIQILRTDPATFSRSADSLFNAVASATDLLRSTTKWAWSCGAGTPLQCVVFCDWVTLQLLGRDIYVNDTSRAYLLLRYFDGRMLTPGEIEQGISLVDQPRELSRERVELRRDPNDGWCWLYQSKLLGADPLADALLERLIQLRKDIGGPLIFRR